MSGGAPLKVIFVAGAGRSGSTLLDRLLGSAPGVASVGELRHIWKLGFVEDEFCGCGEPFSACPFWTKVAAAALPGVDAAEAARIDAAQERLLRLRNAPALTSPCVRRGAFANTLGEWAQRQGRVLRAITEVHGGDTVVDSSKNPMYGLLLTGVEGIDLRVLHLVRDSRAVAYSWTRRVKPHPLRGGEPTFDLAKTWQAGTWWTAANVLSESLPPLRRRYLRIRYEDLAREPAKVMKQVCAFADLRPVQPVEGTTATFDLGVNHTTGGNPMRWETGPVEVRADDAWRRALPAGQRRAVTAMTWPLLLRYRYGVTSNE